MASLQQLNVVVEVNGGISQQGLDCLTVYTAARVDITATELKITTLAIKP